MCRDAEQAFGLISCTEWGLHERDVTITFVGSYPAFPPLQRMRCGIFLLHFPWSRLHRTLSCTLALWCSDFPRELPHATVRLSLSVWYYSIARRLCQQISWQLIFALKFFWNFACDNFLLFDVEVFANAVIVRSNLASSSDKVPLLRTSVLVLPIFPSFVHLPNMWLEFAQNKHFFFSNTC